MHESLRRTGSPTTSTSSPAPTVAHARIIVWALIGGQLMFGTALLFLASQDLLPLAARGVPYLDWIALGVAATCLGVAFLVRGMVWGRMRPPTSPTHQRAAYCGGTLVFAALLEAGVLLNLIVVMLLPQPWVNLGAAALLFVVMLVSLPSEEQFSELAS